jgi:hypothetical protein
MCRLGKRYKQNMLAFFFQPAKIMGREEAETTGHGTVPVLEVDGMTASLSHLKGVEIQVR